MRLLITEKESVAERLAQLLGAFQQDGYYITPEYIIIGARGHLIVPTIGGLRSWRIPSFDFRWHVPKGNVEKLKLIKELYQQADEVIIATDWDREGEVIGERIYAYLVGDLDNYHLPRRMYFSALTQSEITRALNDIKQMDEALLAQGHARNYADAVIGLNLTKMLTKIYKHELNFDELSQAVSLGRVQSPVLNYIADLTTVEFRKKDNNINEFDNNSTITYIETPQGHIQVDLPDDVQEVELVRYETREEEIRQSVRLPNTDDAFSEVEAPPDTAMNIMESLYLRGYMTYPRTESTHAPEDVLKEIEKAMKKYNLFPSDNFTASNVPSGIQKAGKLPLLPTVEGIEAYVSGKLSKRDLLVFTWLLKRMVLAFAPPLKEKTKYAVLKHKHGETRKEFGKEIENAEDCVKILSFDNLPEIDPGKYRVVRINIKRKTKWVEGKVERSYYNLSDKRIVDWMSLEGIGTEATRQTYAPLLRERKYIDEVNLPTRFGEVVAGVIKKIGLDTSLTVEMEQRINEIASLSDLKGFKGWVNKITVELIERLENVERAKLLFECPEGHPAKLVNRFFNGSRQLLLRCETCNKFYPI